MVTILWHVKLLPQLNFYKSRLLSESWLVYLADKMTNDVLSKIDDKKRNFLIQALSVLGGIGTLFTLKPFITSWLPNPEVAARNESITVDLSNLKPGQKMTVTWHGKPIWIIRRTPSQLAQLHQLNNQLRDPQSLVPQQPTYARNIYRSLNPNYLVLVGICTHLGCVPHFITDASLTKKRGAGLHCPCHGSDFDMAGRVFKGAPAPINLEVPPYKLIGKHTLVIGEENV